LSTRGQKKPAIGFYEKVFFIQVREYLLDDHRVFDGGDHFNCAGRACLNVDIEQSLEPLSLGYRGSAFLDSSRVVGLSNTQRNDHSLPLLNVLHRPVEIATRNLPFVSKPETGLNVTAYGEVRPNPDIQRNKKRPRRVPL